MMGGVALLSDVLTPVRAVLVATPRRWEALVEATPPDLLDRIPVPGEWSATACLSHLVDTERWVLPVRLQAFLDGRDIQALDPDTEGTRGYRPAAELAPIFTELRGRSLELLARVDPDDLGRTAQHSELGTVQLRELLNEWAAHDLNHMIQAERALMQEFISGSGPWRHYFVDHELG